MPTYSIDLKLPAPVSLSCLCGWPGAPWWDPAGTRGHLQIAFASLGPFCVSAPSFTDSTLSFPFSFSSFTSASLLLPLKQEFLLIILGLLGGPNFNKVKIGFFPLHSDWSYVVIEDLSPKEYLYICKIMFSEKEYLTYNWKLKNFLREHFGSFVALWWSVKQTIMEIFDDLRF